MTSSCVRSQQLKTASGLTYEQFAERANVARGTVLNYLTKPRHHRGTRVLERLLDASR
jgi:transcriptional regulator with XRE-family HTH domain